MYYRLKIVTPMGNISIQECTIKQLFLWMEKEKVGYKIIEFMSIRKE